MVHILTSIPNFSRAEAIAKALSVDTRRVQETLFELKKMGFVESKEDGSWTIGRNRLHLEKGSTQIMDAEYSLQLKTEWPLLHRHAFSYEIKYLI